MKNGNEDMDDSATHDKCCYMPVGRDRKIRTALRTHQIAGFVSVPSKKEINTPYSGCEVIFPNPEEAREIMSKISARVIR